MLQANQSVNLPANSKFVFRRTPSLLTGTNLLVCNMSLSDMLMCITAAPLTPLTSFTGRWYLGQLFCKVLPACQVTKDLLEVYCKNET